MLRGWPQWPTTPSLVYRCLMSRHTTTSTRIFTRISTSTSKTLSIKVVVNVLCVLQARGAIHWQWTPWQQDLTWLASLTRPAPSPTLSSASRRMNTRCCATQSSVLHTHGTYQEVCRRPCPQPTSCRPCMPSLLNSRGWPWSSSGSTGTITCTEDHCLARRTTTAD